MSDINKPQTPTIDTDEIVQKAKDELIKSLAGNQNNNTYGWTGTDPKTGQPAPKDWNEIPDKILSKTEEIAEQKAQAILDKRDKEDNEAKKKLEEKAKLDKQAKIENFRNEMSRDFFNLVTLGEVEGINDEIAQKLKSGTKYADLTEDEKKDPGLVTWNELQQLHADKYAKGESTSLIETFKKFSKNKSRQTSKEAPVMGNEPAAQLKDDDMPPLEELRKKASEMGWR